MGLMYRVIRKYRDEMNICTFEPRKHFINHENFLNVYFDRYTLTYELYSKHDTYIHTRLKAPSRVLLPTVNTTHLTNIVVEEAER